MTPKSIILVAVHHARLLCAFLRLITDIICQTYSQEKGAVAFNGYSSFPVYSACVSAAFMTTVALLVSESLGVLGLCLLPTTLCMFVSIQAENL